MFVMAGKSRITCPKQPEMAIFTASVGQMRSYPSFPPVGPRCVHLPGGVEPSTIRLRTPGVSPGVKASSRRLARVFVCRFFHLDCWDRQRGHQTIRWVSRKSGQGHITVGFRVLKCHGRKPVGIYIQIKFFNGDYHEIKDKNIIIYCILTLKDINISC